MQIFIVEKNQAGQRFDKFLKKYLPAASSNFIYKMLRKKNITLNGQRADGKEILQINDEIKCFFSDETFAKFAGLVPFDTPEKKIENIDEQKVEECPSEESESPEKKKAKRKKHNKKKQDNAPATEIPLKDDIAAALPKESEAPKAKMTNIVNLKADISEYKKAYEKLSEENIRVIYEDENILILNKPVGVLTQKAENNDLSLNEWMIGYLLKNGRIKEEDLRLFKPSVCNRLDRNTSGLVLCGTSLAGSQKLNELIKNRNIRKYYRTICVGEITSPGVLEGNLTKDHKKNKVTIDEEGEAIQTAYTPIQKLKKKYTYLEVELITGKTHQIRAHLASIEHALVGDAKYGVSDVNQHFLKKYKLDSQLLHAYRLEFPVMTGEFEPLSEMVFLAPLPKEFKTILKDLA